MNYPIGNKPRGINKLITNANRGMSLENDINTTNERYASDNIAFIYKKPTPIKVVNVDYPRRELAKITEAYYTVPSTTDYNGIYKGKYIDFEAKECKSLTAFPFSYIHPHQIKHLENITKQGGIGFIIIRMTSLNYTFLIKAEDFIDYYNTTSRKSLPIDWIKSHGYEIINNYVKPCDYIKALDKAFMLKEI